MQNSALTKIQDVSWTNLVKNKISQCVCLKIKINFHIGDIYFSMFPAAIINYFFNVFRNSHLNTGRFDFP